MFELHVDIPGKRSAEYQATILLKFLIIMHNYVTECLDNQPIKITTRFYGSDDVIGWY